MGSHLVRNLRKLNGNHLEKRKIKETQVMVPTREKVGV